MTSKKFDLNIVLFNCIRFTGLFVPILPYYLIYFESMGVNVAQLGLSLVFFTGTAFLLEVPSGVAADRFSRKYVIFLAQVFLLCALLIWYAMPNFTGLIIGQVLWGAHNAFMSGTVSAYLYDYLVTVGKKDEFAKKYAHSQGYFSFGLVAASLVGLLLYSAGYPYLFLLTIVVRVLSLAMVLLLRPVNIQKSTGETRYFELLGSGFSFITKQPHILWFCVYVAVLTALFYVPLEYTGLLGVDIGLAARFVAFLAMIESAGRTCAGFVTPYFSQYKLNVMRFVPLVLGVVIVLFYQVPIWVFAILLFCYALLGDIAVNTNEVILQDMSRSSIRATVSSLGSFFGRIIDMILFAGFGVFAEVFSLQVAVLGVGCAMIVLVVPAFLLSRRYGMVIIKQH